MLAGDGKLPVGKYCYRSLAVLSIVLIGDGSKFQLSLLTVRRRLAV